VTDQRHARLVLSPLLLLVALLTTLGLNASSAAASLGPETRVRALDTPTATVVGPTTAETPASVGCLRPSQPSVVSGSCVATNTALQFADDGVLGFGSMSSFRRAYGSAGPNAQWHHVVEQTPGNVTQFGATSIHNTSNIVRLDTAIHRQVSGYYSSVQPFTSGQTVRQWLSSQPFDAQTRFGLDVLKQFGAAG
jgi:hypothetical protein